jgi:hypothetical protein
MPLLGEQTDRGLEVPEKPEMRRREENFHPAGEETRRLYKLSPSHLQ